MPWPDFPFSPTPDLPAAPPPERPPYAVVPGVPGTSTVAGGEKTSRRAGNDKAKPMCHLKIQFVNYGGTVWTPEMRAKIYASLERIRLRCEAIIKKVDREIQRATKEERPDVQAKVLPELNRLREVLQAVIHGIESDASANVYYYKLPPGNEVEDPNGRAGGPLWAYTWIGINSSIRLDQPALLDPVLFHELTHFFADTLDNDSRGKLNYAANLEDVYNNTDSMGIGGGYRYDILEKARTAKPPAELRPPPGWMDRPGVDGMTPRGRLIHARP